MQPSALDTPTNFVMMKLRIYHVCTRYKLPYMEPSPAVVFCYIFNVIMLYLFLSIQLYKNEFSTGFTEVERWFFLM